MKKPKNMMYELHSLYGAYANTPVKYRDRIAGLTWDEIRWLIEEASK